MRRVAHVPDVNEQGLITICSFISPDEAIRTQVAEIIGKEWFHLVHVDAELEFCKAQEPELYAKAERGELQYLPGVDMAYDVPGDAEIVIRQTHQGIDADEVMTYLAKQVLEPSR